MQIKDHGTLLGWLRKKSWVALFSMKLSLILTMAICLQAAAYGYAQTISLSLSNAPLETAFKEIKKQTGFRFVYTRTEIQASKPVTLHVSNKSLQEVLSLLFSQQSLEYVIEGNHVVIRRKEKMVIAPHSPIDIQGKVVTEDGSPIAGASVLIKGTGMGISTNAAGEFSLTGLKETDVLIISSIGYQLKEIEVGKDIRFLVVLSLVVNSLDETVVIAYGKTTRRLNTGSVGRVSAAEIGKQPVSNPLAALQGRIPGLLVTQSNGLPGSNFEILIRGRNSIQQGNSPLILVDGVPFSTERMSQNLILNANNPFNTIDPGDIASIEVLKDADATAIYGSRGANGVILISTKRSKSDKPEFSVNWYSGWGTVTRTMDFMKTPEYIRMRIEAFNNDGVTPTPANAPDLLVWDSTRYTNWKKEMIGNTAYTTNVNLRYAAGTDLTKFSFSGGYYKERTVFPGDFGNTRLNFGIGLSQFTKNRKLFTDFIIKYSVDKSNLLNQDLTSFINQAPNAPAMYDSAGNLRWYEKGIAFSNPFGLLLQTYAGTTSRLSINGAINYKIFSELAFKLNLGYNLARFSETSLTPIKSQHPANNPRGSASFGSSDVETIIIEPQFEYTRSLQKLIVSTIIGSSFQKSNTLTTLLRGTGYTNDILLESINGAANSVATSSKEIYKYVAGFARLSLSYDKKYILNLTGRRDGSSRFGPGNQFANFGAVGAGWIFTSEKFAKKFDSWLSFGKIRGSYGVTGNDQISNYQYLESWSSPSYTYGGIPGLRPIKLFNPNYRWEQNRKLELALEMGFWKDRVVITTNWFRNLSGNQIINYVLPAQTGFQSVLRNFPGLIQNAGTELIIETQNIHKPGFRWSSSFNLTWSRNKLLEFPGLESTSYASKYRVNEPLNILIGYQYIGVNPQTGVYEFKDINNDGQINTLDYTLIGTTDPDYYGGFNNEFEWKGIQLSFFLQFIKQKGRNFIYGSLIRPGRNAINQYEDLVNRWTKPGDVARYQRYTSAIGTAAYNAGGLLPSSSAVLTNASFIRLKNISVSYDMGKKFKILALQSFRIFLQAQNLLTITKYAGGDPENQNSQALPPLKMIVAGMQIKL